MLGREKRQDQVKIPSIRKYGKFSWGASIGSKCCGVKWAHNSSVTPCINDVLDWYFGGSQMCELLFTSTIFFFQNSCQPQVSVVWTQALQASHLWHTHENLFAAVRVYLSHAPVMIYGSWSAWCLPLNDLMNMRDHRRRRNSVDLKDKIWLEIKLLMALALISVMMKMMTIDEWSFSNRGEHAHMLKCFLWITVCSA
jgi:hypothetical protein